VVGLQSEFPRAVGALLAQRKPVVAPIKVAASAVGRAVWMPAKVGALKLNERLRSLGTLLCRFVALVAWGASASR
jgi:hypothetical protein